MEVYVGKPRGSLAVSPNRGGEGDGWDGSRGVGNGEAAAAGSWPGGVAAWVGASMQGTFFFFVSATS